MHNNRLLIDSVRLRYLRFVQGVLRFDSNQIIGCVRLGYARIIVSITKR